MSRKRIAPMARIDEVMRAYEKGLRHGREDGFLACEKYAQVDVDCTGTEIILPPRYDSVDWFEIVKEREDRTNE